MLPILTLLLQLAQAAELLTLPGSEVRLPAEPGFIVADRWVGVARPGTEASVMVTRLDAPVTQLLAGLTSDALAGQGVVVEARGPTEVGGYAGEWIEGRQGSARVYLAVVGDGTRAWILKGVAFKKKDRTPIQRILRGAVWGETAPAELVFTMDTPAGMAVAAEIQGARIYTPGGVMGTPGVPLLVVAPSIRPLPATEASARSSLATTAGFAGLEVDEVTPVVLGGRHGWDLRGRATDPSTGQPLVAWQRMVFAPDGTFIRLVGSAPREDGDAWVAAWVAAAETLREGP
jgi:hypothetical protein